MEGDRISSQGCAGWSSICILLAHFANILLFLVWVVVIPVLYG